MQKLSFYFLFVVLFNTSCIDPYANWHPINYTADPKQAGQNIEEEFEGLVLTAKRFRPSLVKIKKSFASLHYTGRAYPGGHTVAIPFREIITIKVVQNGDEFAVEARDINKENKPLYIYIATSKQKAIHFANVLAALKERSRN